MAKNEVQVLILVDVRDGVPESEIRSGIPDERFERYVLRLSEHGSPKWPATDVPHDYDWPSIGRAIEEISEKVHDLQRKAKDCHTVVYIGGKGPLAAFIHLGYKFAQSVHRVEVLWTMPEDGPSNAQSSAAPLSSAKAVAHRS